MSVDLTHIDTWLFDLDNTLYPPEVGYLKLVEAKILAYFERLTGLPSDEAWALQKKYLNAYGTAVPGLVEHHGVDPHEFMAYVHDVPLDSLQPDSALRRAVARLPGRKLVFTNGSAWHAERVLAKLDLADLFDEVFHAEASNLIPKPDQRAFDALIAAHAITPQTTAFFEDRAVNLAPAARLGMTTILVGPEAAVSTDAFVQHRTATLAPFIDAARVKGARFVSQVADLQSDIDALWERRADLTPQHIAEKRLVDQVLDALDAGELRVAEKSVDGWTTHQWLKKAALLSFRLNDNQIMGDAAAPGPYWDKVPSKFAGWGAAEFKAAGFRAVPGCVVRQGAYIAPNVVLMPSFVNVGRYVDEGTMIDTWATVGSCAQIGKNVHLSGGAGIGGVFEPLQAAPTIIGDGCFIGARSEVAEGVIVEDGAVLSMGVFISASTKIVDRKTGEVYRSRVPAYSVVAPGSLPNPHDPNGPNLACAVIVKTVDAQTRSKTSVNDLLRE